MQNSGNIHINKEHCKTILIKRKLELCRCTNSQMIRLIAILLITYLWTRAQSSCVYILNHALHLLFKKWTISKTWCNETKFDKIVRIILTSITWRESCTIFEIEGWKFASETLLEFLSEFKILGKQVLQMGKTWGRSLRLRWNFKYANVRKLFVLHISNAIYMYWINRFQAI